MKRWCGLRSFTQEQWEKKHEGFKSESGFESKMFWTWTRESFLKKLKGFESFKSKSQDSFLHYPKDYINALWWSVWWSDCHPQSPRLGWYFYQWCPRIQSCSTSSNKHGVLYPDIQIGLMTLEVWAMNLPQWTWNMIAGEAGPTKPSHVPDRLPIIPLVLKGLVNLMYKSWCPPWPDGIGTLNRSCLLVILQKRNSEGQQMTWSISVLLMTSAMVLTTSFDVWKVRDEFANPRGCEGPTNNV